MSDLGFLEKLLDGAEAEWKPIETVGSLYGGLTGKSKADFQAGTASYVSYMNIFRNAEVDFDRFELVSLSEGEKQNAIRHGDVLFTGSSERADEAGISSAVTTNTGGNIYLNSFSFGLRFNEDISITPEFSRHLFRSDFMRKQIVKTASGVTRFNISKARFKKVLVPIPCPDDPEKSLAIQGEIVRMLDTFTALTAELTTELAARKKQYNHYRDQLFCFENTDVEWKNLGDVCDFQNGFAFKSSLFLNEGLPIIRIKNVSGGSVNMDDVKYFDPADYRENTDAFTVKKGDILVAMSGATTGKIGYYAHDLIAYLNQRVGKFLPNVDELNARYLYHFLLSQNQKIYSLAGGGAQPNLSSNALKAKINIPIPYPSDPVRSVAEQKRIAIILDKLDTLTTSLSEGLPREIALRQQQYEYYRDLLLSFPKPEEATEA